ncbi:MAG: SpoIID/LytB domain-containing protein [Eubacteriales bacterium]|nr:SpoIID/LytB domain-containing protein [Eubacteriales bacterium]
MYRKRLKQKVLLLVCLTGFLILLVARGPGGFPEKEAEEGERLVLPEDEEAQEPAEVFSLPGADARIRVLLLSDEGSIYHEKAETEKDYPGELQYYEEEEGWVIVNEVPLEEYLCRVVPSEMPSGYAQEALKAQAVCARTYAVWQMQEYAYPEYEAHVDDSTSYQVYNNIESQQTTDQAVRDTAGQIMLYEDRPVKAYYFATSCGATTDENIWEEGDRTLTPYISGRMVDDGEAGDGKDLTDEETFAAFIRKKHAGDLEISEPWYRWSCYVPLGQIKANVEKWARQRAQRTEQGILLQEGDGCRRMEEDSIGEITEARITERNTGGAAQEMILSGTEGTLRIRYEYNIRLMLGLPGGAIHKNDGTDGEGGDLLPSGYFVLEPVTEDGVLAGYEIFGGGLGHGAGMSQNGARIMAEQGEDYESILHYFYREIRLAILQ